MACLSKNASKSFQLLMGVLALAILSCDSQPQIRHDPVKTGFVRFTEKSPQELRGFHAVLHTSLGKIEVEFLPDIAPEHTRNFLRLSQLGFYDHTAWHRIVRGFVIQGGDMGTREPPLQPAEFESGVKRLKPEFSSLKHIEGTLSMARGEELDSAETSFFICLAPQPVLDGKYTIFGRVVHGMDVVKKISDVPLDKSKPRQRVEIVRVEILHNPNS